MGRKRSGHAVRIQPDRERRAGARTAHDVLNALEFTLAVASRGRVGRRAPVTLRLRNTSNRPAEVHFLGRSIVFDIIIARDNGAIVWRRLAHGVGPSILQLRTLAPGEFLVVPKGVEHRPVAAEEVELLIMDREGEPNTGAEPASALTRHRLDSI